MAVLRAEIADMKAFLKTFGKNGGGVLSKADLRILFEDFTAAEIDELSMVFDKDGVGAIHSGELAEWLSGELNGPLIDQKESSKGGSLEMLRSARHRPGRVPQCLARGDSMISKDVLRPVLGDFTDIEIDTIFEAIDKDGDGVVQYNEFVEWVIGDSAISKDDVKIDFGGFANVETDVNIHAVDLSEGGHIYDPGFKESAMAIGMDTDRIPKMGVSPILSDEDVFVEQSPRATPRRQRPERHCSKRNVPKQAPSFKCTPEFLELRKVGSMEALRNAIMASLTKLDNYVVQHEDYKKAVLEVVGLMGEANMTLNHVRSIAAFERYKRTGHLRAPALEASSTCLDQDDLCKGIGYYHFSRISTGTMVNAPNFNVDHGDVVMLFINPRVLLTHHFIVCTGNVAKTKLADYSGRLNSMMTEKEALKEALRAVHKLKRIIRVGVDHIPARNEIAVFAGVKSSFVYPHVAVLEHSPLRSIVSACSKYLLTVCPMSRRHEAGKNAIRLAGRIEGRGLEAV